MNTANTLRKPRHGRITRFAYCVRACVVVYYILSYVGSGEKRVATRTGLPTFLKLSKTLCRLFNTYRVSIDAAIDASTLSSENKTLLKNSVIAIEAACDVVDIIIKVWE